MHLPLFLTLNLLSLLLPCFTSSQQDDTFTNPIIDGNSADPFVIYLAPYYYMLLSTETEHALTIYQSQELTNFRNAPSQTIYRCPPGYHNVWASEMHVIDNQLYIYFAMGVEGDFNRNWVIKALDPSNPMGNWTEAQRVNPNLEQPAVDGTILRHNNQIYFVWSGRDMIPGSIPHDSILISEMIDPMTAKDEFTVVRQPLLPWERNVNEGPFFIYNKNVSYLLFAASFTFSEYYCLGLMSIDQGLDPMIAENWWYGPEDGPVFEKNEEEHVYGSGHASFTVSPDGTETWVVYHAADNKERIEHYRVARAEKVTWDPETGRPVFPRPHGYYSPIPLPSGQTTNVQKTTFTNPIISGDSPDPRVLLLNGVYYMTLASGEGTAIKILASDKLTNFRNTPSSTVWGPNSGICFTEVWAPEMRNIGNELFIYFSAKSCSGGTGHTVYGVKAVDKANPMGEWGQPKALLLGAVDAQTADGTVLEMENGEMYLAFESYEAPYGLHIAKMGGPLEVEGTSRKVLLTPGEEWHQGVVNGPAFLRRGNKTFMAYSGGNPGGQDYCTGLRWIEDGRDPMEQGEWREVYGEGPVFCKNPDEAVYGPGHVGFTTSPDGSETFITYHAAEWPDRIFGDRIARIEKLTWDQEGKPVFPKAHGYFSPQPLPSGQN